MDEIDNVTKEKIDEMKVKLYNSNIDLPMKVIEEINKIKGEAKKKILHLLITIKNDKRNKNF